MSRFSEGNQRVGSGVYEELPGVTKDWDWSGISRKGNRRSIPPNYMWTAENVRLENGNIRSRRGIAKVNTSDASASTCILGMVDLPTLIPNNRLIITLGNYVYLYQPSFSKGTVYDLNPDSSGGVDANANGFIVKHNGAIWMASGSKLTIKAESEGSITASATAPLLYPTPDQNLVSFPTPVNTQEASATNLPIDRAGLNDLWWANSDSVWRYNDVTAIEDATSITGARLLGSLNEQMFVATNPIVEGSSTSFYIRGFNGTWSGVTAPTFTVSVSGNDEFVPLGWTYYKGKALIHGYFTETGGTGIAYGGVLIWDGTNLTEGTITAGRVGSSEVAPLGILDATVFNGNYYYTYTVDTTEQSWIGKYNNTTFDNTNIDVNAIASTAAHYPTAIGAVGGYMVFVADVGGSGGQEFWRSQNLSAWTALTTNTTESNSGGNTADETNTTALV